MKKGIKRLGIFFGIGLTVILMLVGALLFSPELQRRVAVRILAIEADQVQLDGLRLSPDLASVELQGLRLVIDDVGLKLASAHIQGGLLSAVLGKRMDFERLELTGLELDLTQRGTVQQEAPTADPFPYTLLTDRSSLETFDGCLQQVQFPAQLSLRDLQLDAHVLMSATRSLDVAVHAQGIVPGMRPTLKVDGTFTDNSASAEIEAIGFLGTLTLEQSEQNMLSSVRLDTVVTAKGPLLATPTKLHALASVQVDGPNEMYQLDVKNITEAATPMTVFTMTANFAGIEKKLTGEYSVKARTADVQPFILDVSMFQFALTGEGTFAVNVAAGSGNLQANALLKASDMGAMDRRLAQLPNLDTDLAVNIEFTPQTCLLKQLQAQVQHGEQASLGVELLRPIELDARTLQKWVTQPQGDVLAIRAWRVPLVWIDPWLQEVALLEGLLSFDMVLSHAQNVWRLQADNSLLLEAATVHQSGQVLVERLGLSVRPDVQLKGSKLQVELADVNVVQNSATLCAGDLTVRMDHFPNVRFSAVEFDVYSDLGALTTHPFATDYQLDYPVETGEIKLRGSYALAGKDRGAINVQGQLTNLAARGSAEAPIDTVAFSVHGLMSWPETMQLKIPVKMSSSRGATDCVFNVSAALKEEVTRFDATLTGDAVVIDDVLALKRAFTWNESGPADTANNKDAPHRNAAEGPAPDTQPAWVGYEGTLTLDLYRLSGFRHELQHMQADVQVKSDALYLKTLQGSYFGAEVDGTGSITFQPASALADRYAMESQLSMQGLNTHELIRHGLRNESTRLNGVYDVQLNVHGHGQNLETVLNHLQGTFDLEGGRGSIVLLADKKLLRGFSQITSTVVGVGGSLLGALGVDINETDALVELVNLLERIDYDRVRLQGSRGSDLDINIEQILLSGPRIRLEGSGVIKEVAKTPFGENPLRIKALLSARGKTADLFRKVGWISGKEDKDGFYPGLPFEITGSVSNPNYQKLLDKVQQAVDQVRTFGLGGSDASKEGPSSSEVEETRNTSAQTNVPPPMKKPQAKDVVRDVLEFMIK